MHELSGKYCIVGVGSTEFGKLPGRSTESLSVEAIKNALDDAGVEKSEIDAVLCKMPTSAPQLGYSLAISQRLGIVPRVTTVIDQEGATNMGLIAHAMICMELGQCEAAVISYADNPRTGHHTYHQPMGDGAAFGWRSPAAHYAMIARRHMYEYGTTHDHLGAIAVAVRKHGAMNPKAQLRKPLTLEEYHQSPWIAEPFHTNDCCLVSDGALAVVVMSVAKAKSLGITNPVRIAGLGQGHPAWDVPYRRSMTTTGALQSGRQAFAMAGLKPSDVDVAELYDCFTIVPLITLEEYGFCKKGEGGPFCEGGRIELGGELPINTSGGLLSETGTPGMQHIIEAVRQLRGECGDRQVPNAEVALVSNQGGIMHTHATMLLTK